MRSDKDFVRLWCVGVQQRWGLLVLALLLLLLRQCVHHVLLSILVAVADMTNSSQVTVLLGQVSLRQ